MASLNLDNQLSRVPTQIKSFNQLYGFDVFYNDITSIESGAFNFPDTNNPAGVGLLNLDRNGLMTTIAPGAIKMHQSPFLIADYVHIKETVTFS